MTHAAFIVSAYGITVLIIAGLILRAVIDFRQQSRALAELEARGIGRRSARANGSQPTPQPSSQGTA